MAYDLMYDEIKNINEDIDACPALVTIPMRGNAKYTKHQPMAMPDI